MSESRFEIIPNLNIYEPTCGGEGNSSPVFDEYRKLKYKCKSIRDDDFFLTESNHFPIVLNADGTPWIDACLFLLDKLKNVKKVSPKTLESKASDLVMFRRWLDEETICYLHFPKRIMARPTYRYSAYLREQIDSGIIQFNTAKRRMSSVQLFYRWMRDFRGYEFEYPLWREREIFISLKDETGRSFSKKQLSTDIGFKQSPKGFKDDSYIEDGGNLRPLEKQEQYNLISTLVDIGNTEMTLSFLLSLTSGGRMQSIYTFRRHHFLQSVSESQDNIRIKIGRGTDVDSKYGKNSVLHIPRWLHQRVARYLVSEQSQKRVSLAKHVYENEDTQYAFLTRSGVPYYVADDDPFKNLYRHVPRGIAINAFIRQQLIPSLESKGQGFKFRFHDLRATFGLNYLEEQLSKVSEESNEIWPALLSVKNRLGHSSISTTEKYLNYKKKYKQAVYVQSEFEQHLMNIDI